MMIVKTPGSQMGSLVVDGSQPSTQQLWSGELG